VHPVRPIEPPARPVEPGAHGPAGSKPRLLDLSAIETALLQHQLSMPPGDRDGGDGFRREVIANMISAYAFLDWAVAEKIDMFAMGNLRTMLELNRRVLCGAGEISRRENAGHLQATAERFYDQWGAGIRDVVEWHDRHRGDAIYARAAGVYARMLSEPQLFLEGNHRTGALLASYILLRAGEPPFVVTSRIASEYFGVSAEIQRVNKRSLSMWITMPRLRRRLATLFERAADRRFVLHPA
jgi:hypothetical protein